MSNQISTQTISFYGSQLITLKVDDVIYTAIRPICENIGLDWGGQQKKLSNQMDKFNCRHISTVGNDGRNRQMLCMPLKKLNGWLFSINPEKVRSDLKEKVIQYQEECFEALYNYWHFGKAERTTTTVNDRTGLRDAVNMLVSKKGMIYSEAYNLVHQRFNVKSIEDLTPEQLPQAVEYVHRICLEGELIIQDPKQKEGITLTEDEFYKLAKGINRLNESVLQWKKLEPIFSMLESNPFYRHSYNLGIASIAIAKDTRNIISQYAHKLQDYKKREDIENKFFAYPLESRNGLVRF